MHTTKSILSQFNATFIEERFLNLFTPNEKIKYADDVMDILISSYKSIGGIKGSGFNNTQDMIDNIPFWKVHTNKDGDIDAIMLYKDKSGRKSVAAGTDGTIAGKKAFKNMVLAEMSRSYREVSDGMWRFIQKSFSESEIDKYLIPFERAFELTKGKIQKPSNPPNDRYKDYYYERKIGSSSHVKIMLGTTNLTIK